MTHRTMSLAYVNVQALTMGGPNLEIFKFTLYLVVPLAALIQFGNPEWYRTTVAPVYILAFAVHVHVHMLTPLQYRDKLFPPDRAVQVICFHFRGYDYIFNKFPSGYPKTKMVCEKNWQGSRPKDC